MVIIYYLFGRKLYSSPFKIVNNDHDYDKLMIVAHPDDELIFGGRNLIEERGWKVVCVTCATIKSNYIFEPMTSNVREHEFKLVMNALGCSYEIWDFESYLFNANWDDFLLNDNLVRVLNEKPYQKIVTHNLQGEYGHAQHKKVSAMVHNLKPKNLYVFGYDMNQRNPYIVELQKLLEYYPSQKKVIKKHNKYLIYQFSKPAKY